MSQVQLHVQPNDLRKEYTMEAEDLVNGSFKTPCTCVAFEVLLYCRDICLPI